MDYTRLTILYGSQTGTAQDYAERLWQDAKRRNVAVLLRPMNEYEIKNLVNERYVVFVCSTTGQGDEPDNMKNFWKFLLRRNLPTDSLKNLRFAVLGLGDSSYEKFNFVAKKLYRRLIQLGAENFLDLGLADDQHECGADSVADPWIDSFWQELKKIWPTKINELYSGRLPSKFKLVYLNSSEKINQNGTTLNLQISSTKTNPLFAELIENRRLTPENHFQDTRLIRLKAERSNFRYDAGDVVCVQPKNLDESVEEFTQICDNNTNFSSRKFFVDSNDESFPVPLTYVLPQPCTFYQCLQTYFDLQTTPRRSFFKNFSHFAVDEREKEKLDEFSAAENLQDLYSYCNRPKRTVVEVLRDFPDTTRRVPLEYWFDLLTPIRARPFSIASSPNAHPNEIHILLAVVRYKTMLAKNRLGLCSNFLARLKVGDKVPIWPQRGIFRFPDDAETSTYVMIGPGTGVAPFRSIIHERENKNSHVLFFGCRNEKADFYFADEWREMSDKNLLKFFVAFSRDQERKIYVQHKIEDNFDYVADLLLNRNAYVFIAGSANQMPKDVVNALKLCVKRALPSSLDEHELDQFFKKLGKENRLQFDVWS